ncbi:MAG: hypothetical protein Q8M79_02380 [Dehalococcoidia bacterium]|nr:hypothetical protein [Dehalococcoidia bacterium]
MIVGSLAILAGIIGVIQGSTAANYVPPTFAGTRTVAYDLNQLAPYECAALGVAVLVYGSGGTIRGTTARDLVLGSSLAETLQGQGGNDCLVGGAGKDTLDGGAGTDICIGNAQATFKGCETKIVR